MGYIEEHRAELDIPRNELSISVNRAWFQPCLSEESLLRRELLENAYNAASAAHTEPFLLFPYGSTLLGYADPTSDINACIAIPKHYDAVDGYKLHLFVGAYFNQKAADNGFKKPFNNQFSANNIKLSAYKLKKLYALPGKKALDEEDVHTVLINLGAIAFLPAIGEYHNDKVQQLASNMRVHRFTEIIEFLEAQNLDPASYWDGTITRILEHAAMSPEPESYDNYFTGHTKQCRNIVQNIAHASQTLPPGWSQEKFIHTRLTEIQSQIDTMNYPTHQQMKKIL